MATFEEKLVESAEAQRLAERMRPDLETLRRAAAKVAALVVRLRNDVHQAQADNTWRMTPAGMAEIENGIRNRTLQAIDSLEQECQTAKASIERALAAVEQRPEGDSQTRILEELQEQRAWARIRPILDRLDGLALIERIGSLAKQAAEAGDDATLRALEAEVPAFLEAKGLVSYTRPVLETIAQVWLPHKPPAARQAIKVRQELEQGWPRLIAAFQQARHEVSGKGGMTVVLPGWIPTESVRL